jgi:TolB-like protein/tetratricopeptide (TPR) repeat protein
MLRPPGAATLVAAFVLAVRPLTAQCPDGSAPRCTRAVAPRGSPIDARPSLTVKYLENASPDSSDVALADGITEEVITRLSQISGLCVTSRYAAIRYRGRHLLDPRRAGRELGVRYVLQGTLRHNADWRVQVAMTEVATGFNAWAQSYDQPLRGVFAMQDSVAVQVAEAVRGRLTRQERSRLAPAPATNPAAYQAYLRGRIAFRARNGAAAAEGFEQYRRAVALDSGFGPAYAGLAQAYSQARLQGWEIPGTPQDSLDQLGLRAAAPAVARDSTSSEAWLAMAMAERFLDARRALDYYQRAVRLDSSSVEALQQLGGALSAFDMLDSALAVERSATARDPFYAASYNFAAAGLNSAGRPLEALTSAAQGIAVDSTFGLLERQRADAYLQIGRSKEARAAAEKAISLGQARAPMRALIAIADFQQGDTVAAVRELESAAQVLRDRMPGSASGFSFLLAFPIAGAYAQLGQSDSAIAWLQRIAPGQRRFFSGSYLSHHLDLEPPALRSALPGATRGVATVRRNCGRLEVGWLSAQCPDGSPAALSWGWSEQVLLWNEAELESRGAA